MSLSHYRKSYKTSKKLASRQRGPTLPSAKVVGRAVWPRKTKDRCGPNFRLNPSSHDADPRRRRRLISFPVRILLPSCSVVPTSVARFSSLPPAAALGRATVEWLPSSTSSKRYTSCLFPFTPPNHRGISICLIPPRRGRPSQSWRPTWIP